VFAQPTGHNSGLACLVLAAGAGKRFGGRKQLAELAGRPLLEHAIASANAAPASRVVVVLGAHAAEIQERVAFGRAEPVVCESWGEGMAAPLRRGIAAVHDAEAALVLLGDQPLVTVAAIERVVAGRAPGNAAVRATYGGAPGHPVLIERGLFKAIGGLRGDAGARALLDRPNVAFVRCDDIADPLDIDTAADLELASARVAR
jgi:molybdenum cofactor cytidylyltransferase